MHNPFEILAARLANIEEILLDLRNADKRFGEGVHPQGNAVGRTLNIKQAGEFVGLTRQTIYRKTSANEIPHFKKAGRVFFDRKELEDWLLSHKVPTKTEYQKMAGGHMADRARLTR